MRLPSGVSLTNFYDFAGRLTNRNSSIGETAGFEYNGNDAVTKMTDNTGSTTNIYDVAGRLSAIAYPSGARVDYAYDLLDRIAAITNKASAGGSTYVTRYEYDPIGNVTNVIDPFNGNTSFELDRVGRKTRRVLPNGVVTTYDYNWRDQVTNIVHKTSGGTTLASVLYERLPGGEPSKITREDGTYVVLGYDGALRLTNETYYASGGTPQTTNSYGYDSSGSRIKLEKGGLAWTNVISGGYRITEVRTNGVVAESYSYDNGGRVTTITQDGITKNLGYNSSDQVAAVTNGATWVTYRHDANGRRTVSTNSTSVIRKFLVASTPGTDLESPQLIANASGSMQQGYVYLGDDPILRYSTGGTAAYYLEDGMGSVIGLAPANSPSTANTTRLFYDGFGNGRGTNGPAPTIPTGTGGDFRFHGAWLEEQSGLYNMRAREYDARLGRFTSRDPDTGNFQAPETFHPYGFANANPFAYSDPSGKFSLIEINISSTISAGLQAFRTAAIQKGRSYARKKIGEFIGDQFLNIIKGFIPIDESTIGKLMGKPNFRYEGFRFFKFAEEFLCDELDLPDSIYFEPQVKRDGSVVSNGINCSNRSSQKPPLGPYPLSPRPDVIISPTPPIDTTTGKHGKAYLIGEIKLSGQSLYRSYYSPKTQESQLDAIIEYARKHTVPRVAVFATLLKPTKTQAAGIKAAIGGKAIKRGVAVFIVSVQN